MSPLLPPLRRAALQNDTCSEQTMDLQSACSVDARSLDWVARSAATGCRRAHKRTRAMKYYDQEMEAVGVHAAAKTVARWQARTCLMLKSR
jgi:hypothetical protein